MENHKTKRKMNENKTFVLETMKGIASSFYCVVSHSQFAVNTAMLKKKLQEKYDYC